VYAIRVCGLSTPDLWKREWHVLCDAGLNETMRKGFPMKKLASVGLGLLLVFTMSVFALGCGDATTEPATDDVNPTELTPVTPPEPAPATADDVLPTEPVEETTPEVEAPVEAEEGMTEEPAAAVEGEESAADSGEALTDEFDDFDYSVGGGAASKRR